MKTRPRDMSQLDYLWTNFGEYFPTNELSEDSKHSIPTQEFVLKLYQQSGSPELKWSILEGRNEAVVTINNSDTSPVVQVEGDTDWIQGKRCLVKQTADGVAICYLSDTDSTKFTDGSDAALDGTMGEYMVHFPANTVKCEVDANDNDILTIAEDGDGFKFREVLLGAIHIPNFMYQGNQITLKESINDADDSSLADIITEIKSVGINNLSVINGATPATDVKYADYHRFIKAFKGEGWSIMDYEARNKVTMLCFAKYSTRDLQAVVGLGDTNYGNVEGATVSLGNAHGEITDTNGKIQNSILGIENYFNNVLDWMGGIDLSIINGKVCVRIYEGCVNQDGSGIDTYRSWEQPNTLYSEELGEFNCVKRMKYGEYADLFPSEGFTAEEITEWITANPDMGNIPYYADACFVLGQDFIEEQLATQIGARVAYCGGFEAFPFFGGSVLFLGVLGPSDAFPVYGARLQYRGNITVIDSPTDFKNL